MRSQWVFRLVTAMLAVCWFVLLIRAIRFEVPLAAAFAIIGVSPLTIIVIAKSIERKARRGMPLRLSDQAWSFIYGDTFALPFAAASAALAWNVLPDGGWYDSWWWTLTSAAVGIIVGFGFHHVDAGYYRERDAEDCLVSPSKEAHDFLSSFPVITGGLVYAITPLLVMIYAYRSWWLLGVAAGIIAFGLLLKRDNDAKVPPLMMHPQWYPRWSWKELFGEDDPVVRGMKSVPPGD